MSAADSASSSSRADVQTAPDAPVLFGKYLFLRELGAGGLGRVDLVQHRMLGIKRALKTISPSISHDPEWRARFIREAQAMAQLNHPHIVAVHHAEVMPEGDAFIDMEYVRGQSLDKQLKAGVHLPLERIDCLLQQLASGLQAAHDIGIVHRDLKPQNLILQEGPKPGVEVLKILDFGIAKILNNSDPEGYVTRPGESLGTPHYMSPEQIAGEQPSVNVASDIYSVGVMLYQLLTGYLPFSGPRYQVLSAHLSTPPPRMADRNPAVQVPRAVEALVRRCLEKDPNQRPPSIRAVADEFHRLVCPPAKPASPPSRRVLPRVILPLAGVVTLALGLALTSASLRPFSVTVDPPRLDLIAGQEPRSIWVRLHGVRSGTPVQLSYPDRPSDLLVEQTGPSTGDLREIRVASDLNCPPSPKPRTLQVMVQAGTKRTTLHIPLTIHAPALVPLPDGFTREAGAELVRVNNRVYPKRIIRHLAQGPSVTFLLVHGQARNHATLPPFYIMENKVWNDLFDAYLRAQPEATRELARRQASYREPHRGEDGSWPVFQVSALEAQQFAAWFVHGAGFRGDLPTREQWDKAAGFYDRDSKTHDKLGPFLRGWRGAAGQIAIDRQTPLPVGQAPLDLSPFGLRDVAGNGEEWTRPPDDPKEFVTLRGRRFDESEPLSYDAMAEEPALSDFRDTPRLAGFRVVIEGMGDPLDPGVGSRTNGG